MEGKKYRIREDISQKIDDNVILYRIEALKDFDDVKKGDIGGWVEKEVIVGYTVMLPYFKTLLSLTMLKFMEMPR